MARLRFPLLGFVFFAVELAFAIDPCGHDIIAKFQTTAQTKCAAMGAAAAACYGTCNKCAAALHNGPYMQCTGGQFTAAAGAVSAFSALGSVGGGMAAGAPAAAQTTTTTAGSTVQSGAAGTTADSTAGICADCPCAQPFIAELQARLQLNTAQGAATTAQASTMSKALSALKSPWVLGAAAVGAGLGYFLGKGSGDEKNADGTEKEPTETPAIPEPAVAEAPPTSSAASSVASQATVVQAPETITNPGVMLTPLGGDDDSDGDTSMTVAQATPYQQDFESTTSSTDDSLNDDDSTTLGAGGGSQNTALASNGDDDSASAGRALAGANTTDAAAAKANAGAGGGAAMGGFSFDSGAGASAAATGSGGQMLMGTPGGKKLASGSSSSRSARRNLAMVVNNLAKSIALVPANSASALPALTPAQERSRLLNTMQSRGLIRKPAK